MYTAIIPWLLTPDPGNDRAADLPLQTTVCPVGISNIALLNATERIEEYESALFALNIEPANPNSGAHLCHLRCLFISLHFSKMTLTNLPLSPLFFFFGGKISDGETKNALSTCTQHLANQQQILLQKSQLWLKEYRMPQSQDDSLATNT